MTDHIPDAGKMVSDRVVMLRTIAAMLDHPSVHMGGPSQRNTRRAEEILAAIAPLIAAAERERCAQVADREADTQRIVRGRQQEDWEYLQKQDAKTDVAENIAAAIRTLD